MRAFAFGPDGNLYVPSFSNEIMRYNGTTGDFIDVFVDHPEVEIPGACIFGPDGNLYINDFRDDQILRFNGTTGEFIDVFASGGGLDGPAFIFFMSESGPNGDFNMDGLWDCADINALVAAVASGSTNLSFDMNGDGTIDRARVTFFPVFSGVSSWVVFNLVCSTS